MSRRQTVKLEPITTFEMLNKISELAVLPEQNKFVGTIDQAFAEAYIDRTIVPLGIFLGKKPIGLITFQRSTETFDKRELPFAHVSRFIIDHRYQGKGYGSDAMRQLAQIVRTYLPDCVGLSLHAFKLNKRAIHVYERLGFIFKNDKGFPFVHGFMFLGATTDS